MRRRELPGELIQSIALLYGVVRCVTFEFVTLTATMKEATVSQLKRDEAEGPDASPSLTMLATRKWIIDYVEGGWGRMFRIRPSYDQDETGELFLWGKAGRGEYGSGQPASAGSTIWL